MRRRPALACVLASGAALALAACGGDYDRADLERELRDDFGATAEQATCAADALETTFDRNELDRIVNLGRNDEDDLDAQRAGQIIRACLSGSTPEEAVALAQSVQPARPD
jgi:hypothetical protein